MSRTLGRVCLVTTGQPSTNPRLVKEADALVEAGYAVHVVGAHWADWAEASDASLMARRSWSLELIDWRKGTAPRLHHTSRFRHWLARRTPGTPFARLVRPESVLARVGPELRQAAMSIPAELYIAHNLGALPAALDAALEQGALAGFDAEDFHSGQLSEDSPLARLTRATERQLLPRCAYVTAASPGIAEAYERLCGIARPTCLLNVFPLADRPESFRISSGDETIRLYWFSQTIGPGRGLETAVAAMGLLREFPTELHLRGQCAAGFSERLMNLARTAGVPADRIHLHAPASADDMTRCASRYDIGLALEPVVNENNDIALSNKIFTYLLAGSAVVATRTRGQARLLPELGTAARGCEPDNPQSMADALRPWLRARTSLDAARRSAWLLGQTTFNWDVEKARFLSVVDQAMRAPAAWPRATA